MNLSTTINSPETPREKNFTHPVDKRFDSFNLANESNHSHAEKLWDILYTDKSINSSIKDLKADELKIRKTKFLSIYHKVEDLFIKTKRSSWEPYFYHLLETAFIRLEESYGSQSNKYPWDILDIFYCLLHDIIEDTRKDFTWLRQDYGEEIAFGTHLISKKPFHGYIPESSTDKEKYNTVVTSMKLTEYKIGLDEYIIETNWLDPDDVEIYNKLRSTYRKVRSVEHFEKYKSFSIFFEYAKQEAKLLKINFSDDKLREICHRIIEVKLCDRLHNLRTMKHINPETINRKITETEKYLLPIAHEINPVMAQKLIDEIRILREKNPLWETAGGIVSEVTKKTDSSLTQNQ